MKNISKLFVILINALMLINLFTFNNVDAATVYETDVNSPSKGNSLVLVEGSFENDSVSSVLKRINDIRYEACKEGIVIPDYKKLTLADYKPLKWSSLLEEYTRIRAAEISLSFSHTRVNGNRCFDHDYGFSKNRAAENIAYNFSGTMKAIEQYYDEKYDLIHNTGKQTGHYINLINPRLTHIAVTTFKVKGSSRYYSAMQLVAAGNLKENKANYFSTAFQKVEVKNSMINEINIIGNNNVDVNKSIKLNLTGNFINYNEKTPFSFVSNATWKSSDNNRAVVTNGTVTGKKAGSVNITASVAGKSKTFKVNVKGQASNIAVTSISLNKSSLTLEVNKSETLKVSINPSNATNKNVTYSSSNTSIATVDNNGKVTAKKAGTATITVKTNNGKSATCKVTVNASNVAVTSISLNKMSLTLNVGNTASLAATINPTNASNKTITYSSSNNAIVTVDSTGKITAKKVGSATITAKTTNGKTATCYVTVKAVEVAVTSISLNKTSLTIKVGASESLRTTIYPTNATNKNVTWTSSNSRVATVDNNGKVTAKMIGSTTITAKSNNGKTINCLVKVNPSNVKVTSVTLSKKSLSLTVGDNATLTASVYPSDAANKLVMYSSNNTSVATVNADGKITAYRAGTATITGKTFDGVYDTCTVTVRSKTNGVKYITLQYPKLVISKGSVATVKATTNLTNPNLTWSTSNSRVATVDNNGKVTGVAYGTCTLIVKADNGVTATLPIYINEYNKIAYGVKVTKGTNRLQLNDKFKFEAVLYPTNRQQVFNWKSSDPSVATIDSNGNVITKKVGVTYISVSDGGQSVSYELIVYDKQIINPSSVSLDKKYISMNVNGISKLNATVYPYNTTVKNVSYTSSNPSIVQVNSDGTLIAKSKGQATITVKTKIGLYKDVCTVVVK